MLARGTMREQIVFRDVEQALPVAVEGNHYIGLAHGFFVNHHLKQLFRIGASLNTAANNDRLITRFNETQCIGPRAVAVHIYGRSCLQDIAKHELESFDAFLTDKCALF